MSTTPPLLTEQFTATKWATAEEKARWANAMPSWIQRGFPEKGWRQGLYERLHQMYCHSAQYNRYGFYDEWFATVQKQRAWLEYVAKGGAFGGGMGDPAWTWCDVERALSAWIRERDLVTHYQHLSAQDTEYTERALLAILQQKYAPKPPDVLLETAAATTVPVAKLPPVSRRRAQHQPQRPYREFSLFEQ